MIQVTPHMQVLVAIDPADFRCRTPGLSAICREIFHEDPTSGAVFCFRNRSATSLMLLFWDGDAYWCCQRSLAKGRLKWWPKGDGAPLKMIDAQELMVLIWNGDPRGVFGEPWKRLEPLRLDEAKERHTRRGEDNHRRGSPRTPGAGEELAPV